MRSIHKITGILLLAGLVTGGIWWTQKSIQGGIHGKDWSDATRQWEVCQYVKARINPYELAYRILFDTFGPATGPDRLLLREQRIYSISSAEWDEDTPGMLPGHPPPEATYPPSTMSMLMMASVGFLPKSALLPISTAVNVLFLILLVAILSRWFRKETSLPPLLSLGIVAALCLLWPPLQLVVKFGQAGILALFCALAGMFLLKRAPILAGALFMVSLIKPSMVLLYFFIPLIQWRWKPLWTTFFLGVILTVIPSFWLHEWPWVLISQWVGLCRYVLQGSFTLQEVFNAIGWENTLRGTLVVFALWGAVFLWCLGYRRARWEEQFAFLSLANLSWTYHERPDFVLIVFPMVLFASKLMQPGRRTGALMGLGFCLLLGLALFEPIYVPDEAWAHAMRWAGRMSLLGLWGVTALGVRTSHRKRQLASLNEG